MRNSNFWYQNIEFPISKNQKYFPLTFFYYMFKNLNLFISENQIFFARNSAFLVLFLYQKIIFWHQKFDFLISENDFFLPKHLLRSCEHFERLNISATSDLSVLKPKSDTKLNMTTKLLPPPPCLFFEMNKQ